MTAPKSKLGLGDNTMRHRAVAAATMIVAAGLIGITQARLPRPVRDYRDRVSIETSAIAQDDKQRRLARSALRRANGPAFMT
jgi:hypothetical protein